MSKSTDGVTVTPSSDSVGRETDAYRDARVSRVADIRTQCA